MRDLTVDLETRPSTDENTLAVLCEDITPPAQMKKPETIAKWNREERQEAIKKAVQKTSLDGAYGHICAISWAFDDEEAQAIVGPDEKELLMTFYSDFEKIANPLDGHPVSIKMINHNLYGFDLPFLRKRSMILGIRPPMQILHAMHARPWDSIIADTMLMWDSDTSKKISLDKLCLLLGLPSPKQNGVDGSQIAEMFDAGQYEEIGEYGKGDVIAARRCYKAMTFQE